MNPEIVEVFHANGRTVPMDELDAGKIVCMGHAVEICGPNGSIDTLSYYFSFSVASNKPPPEKKANLIVLFGDQARDPHKGETRLGLGDWEA
jgi:hypothetical protein